MGFFRNAVGVFATSIASLPIGIATSVLLARWLSVEDRGLYSVAVSFSGMAALVLQLGWPSASIFRLKRIGSDPAQVAAAAIVATLATTLLLFLAALGFQNVMSERFLHGAPPRIFYLAVAIVPFQIMATLFAGIARGIDRFALQNTFLLALTAVIFLATAGVLVIGDGSLEAVLEALLLSQIALTLAFVALVLRHTGVSARIAPGEIRESLRFGLKSYLQSLAGQMHERVDILLLAYLLVTPEQIALYAVAAGVIQRLKVLPEALGSALFPKLAALPDREAARFCSYVCRHSFWWSLLIAIALGISAPFLITLLYGQQYRGSISPFLILLPGMLFLTIYRVLARYFTASDRQLADILTQVVTLSLNVVLNLMWIPRYGIKGSAAASLVSYGLEAFIIVGVFRWLTGSSVSETFLLQAGDIDVYRRRLGAVARRLRPVR